jgi:hypothetical protein
MDYECMSCGYCVGSESLLIDHYREHPKCSAARVAAGARVRLLQPADRYPTFIVPAGAVGTIREVRPDLVSVQMDDPVAGAEEWDNHVHFYDATTYGQASDGWDQFTHRVEFIN